LTLSSNLNRISEHFFRENLVDERINSPGWAIYLRVSNEDKQTPERSFSMQRKSIRDRLLQPSELQLGEEYRDILTGTNSNRIDYQRMLSDAKNGKFSHLGLYRADRFGRDTVEGLHAATNLIKWGIKIRVANMPSMRPEDPDGFFIFLMQMGLAQREVDVMRQRIQDGVEAKYRAGGWSGLAPEGFVNKERQISSGKYERWVEINPPYSEAIRKAWDLLLTDRYTLEQICDQLAKLGYIRSNGRPWAWFDSKTGIKKYSKSTIHRIFHNPFYAGWVVVKRFDIPYGEIRGKWTPIVSTSEFEKGLDILKEHDQKKSRKKRHFYLLRDLLWIQSEPQEYKMFVSTPSGRNQSYSYYITQKKFDGKRLRIPCEKIDSQIPEWIEKIGVSPDQIPSIRKTYQRDVTSATEVNRDTKLTDLRRRISLLKEEEAKLARLLIVGKISEDTYDQLRKEWRDKSQLAENNLTELEKETTIRLDDLNIAILLMTQLSTLWGRLDEKERRNLLQIFTKRIVINMNGDIISYELRTPFGYLRTIADDVCNKMESGSVQVQSGPLN